MRNQASRAIFDYWINIKRDRPAPLRTEINPASLRHLLPHLFITARDEDGIMAFRLAGTRICDLFDREFRGASFAEAWLDLGFRRPMEIIQNVAELERPAYLDIFASNGEYRHPYEMLLLPVRSVEAEPSDRVLGALLPQTSHFPAIDSPVTGLVLEHWTFLTGTGSNFGLPVTGDRRLSKTLSRLLSPRAGA